MVEIKLIKLVRVEAEEVKMLCEFNVQIDCFW
jgi:hypothetical protein